MSLLSDRAGKTAEVVLLPASTEDPSKPPPGLYRIGLFIGCVAIFSFFAALVIAYEVRSHRAPFWDPIKLPTSVWISTTIITISSVTFEIARRLYRRGLHRLANRFLIATACLGMAFLGSQVTAWRNLMERGFFMSENPHSSFFYMFTGLHAAHLIGGLIALFVVVLGRSTRRETVDVVCFYWHFLGVLWIALFAVLLS